MVFYCSFLGCFHLSPKNNVKLVCVFNPPLGVAVPMFTIHRPVVCVLGKSGYVIMRVVYLVDLSQPLNFLCIRDNLNELLAFLPVWLFLKQECGNPPSLTCIGNGASIYGLRFPQCPPLISSLSDLFVLRLEENPARPFFW